MKKMRKEAMFRSIIKGNQANQIKYLRIFLENRTQVIRKLIVTDFK